MNEQIRQIVNKCKEDRRLKYEHIGYRKGKRLVMYERLAGHPIDKIIPDGRLKRQRDRFWFRTLRSGYYNTLYVIGLFTPDFGTWWEKVRR